MGEPLRIGLIGAGWVTQHHLAAWAGEAARARVVAIADPSLERARERASAFGIGAVHADAEAMFAAGGLDAVDIAAPREAHAALVRLAAQHGVPALCQKPLAPTYDTAHELADEITGSRAMRLMVHENWRFRPYYRQLGAWLRAGRIGRVVQAQMTLLSSGLIADAHGTLPLVERQPFIATLERALVMEVLIHHIDTSALPARRDAPGAFADRPTVAGDDRRRPRRPELRDRRRSELCSCSPTWPRPASRRP